MNENQRTATGVSLEPELALATVASEPDIDMQTLGDILDGMASHERRLFLAQFARDIASLAVRARAAAAAGDTDALERVTHSLKGVAGTIGGRALHLLAAALNDEIRRTGLCVANAGEAISELSDALLRALAELGGDRSAGAVIGGANFGNEPARAGI